MRYLNVNVLIWVCYIWHVDLGYVFSLVFEGKLCYMFCHGIQFSVNTHLFIIQSHHDIVWWLSVSIL